MPDRFYLYRSGSSVYLHDRDCQTAAGEWVRIGPLPIQYGEELLVRLNRASVSPDADALHKAWLDNAKTVSIQSRIGAGPGSKTDGLQAPVTSVCASHAARLTLEPEAVAPDLDAIFLASRARLLSAVAAKVAGPSAAFRAKVAELMELPASMTDDPRVVIAVAGLWATVVPADISPEPEDA